MYPTKQETVTIGRVTNEPQRGPQQISPAQYQQMYQQMQAQMAAMQQQLENQRQQQQPVEKTYSMGQVQILLSCETINHVLEEFELSVQKTLRLKMARDYLLKLADLAEFIKRPEPDVEPEPGMDQSDVPMDQLYEETPDAPQDQDTSTLVEPYSGQPDKTVTEEIEKINRKMAELKKENIIQEKEKKKTGFEKIKDFISKKNVPTAEDSKKNYDKYDVPEGVG